MAETRTSRYKLIEKLGEGGMGIVYKAEDTKLKRTVALKYLRPESLAGDDQPDRFLREAQAAAALDHPNICTVYEIDDEDDKVFISMAFLEGTSLARRIKSGALPLDEALDYAIQMAEGLEAAHKRGVVHRDVKSANVMITSDGHAKIMDFGLALVGGREQETTTSVLAGTVAYMSPEQARCEKIDHRTDIWSLGVCLYEMIAGRLPFEGDYDHALIYNIMNESPKPLPVVRPGVPIELDRVVSTALAKSPEDRYRVTAEMIADLKAIRAAFQYGTLNGVSPSAHPKPSIAVLPFANMSTDREQEYFCDGIAEDLINYLTRVGGLRVAARTSSFSFKGKQADIREIGRKLGVDMLLEGSVRKAGKRLRITAQLINVSDGYHVWSERYDRDLEDIFAIQDEISKKIVEALKLELSEKEKRALEKAATRDIEAYDLYLRGRKFFYHVRRKSYAFAREMFSKAIKKDPNYALAYAGMADCYSFLYKYHASDEENLGKAMDASRKALDLDPELAEAHAARGLAVSLSKRFEEAEREFEKAIELNPKLYEAYYFYARNCYVQGQLEKAAQLYEQAALVNPEDCQSPMLLGQTYVGMGLEEKAKQAYRRGVAIAEKRLELNPDDVRALSLCGSALMQLGDKSKAIDYARHAVSIDDRDPTLVYSLACVLALGGEKEEAVEYLERAVEAGFADKDWIKQDSDFESLRDHPRYTALLERMA
jgi:serine/threonine protein kinase/tetratricopeptide (TPR) repeat protein